MSSPTAALNQPPASRPRALPASARPHCPKRFSRKSLSRAARSPTLRMPQIVESLFGRFADSRNFADVERREKSRFLAWDHPEDAVGLGLIGSDFRDQAGVAIPIEQFRSVARFILSCSLCAASKGGPCRRSVPVTSRYASSMEAMSTSGEKLFRTAGLCANSRDNGRDGRRRKWLAGRVERRCAAAWRNGRRICGPHRRRRRRRRADRAASDDDWFAFERGVEKFFDGDEEGVHVDVEIGAHLPSPLCPQDTLACALPGPEKFVGTLRLLTGF